MTVAALFVERGGVYWDLEGVDPWDEAPRKERAMVSDAKRLERARYFARSRWRSLTTGRHWCWDIWEFGVEPYNVVRMVAASLALDGMPARWPDRPTELPR